MDIIFSASISPTLFQLPARIDAFSLSTNSLIAGAIAESSNMDIGSSSPPPPPPPDGSSSLLISSKPSNWFFHSLAEPAPLFIVSARLSDMVFAFKYLPPVKAANSWAIALASRVTRAMIALTMGAMIASREMNAEPSWAFIVRPAECMESIASANLWLSPAIPLLNLYAYSSPSWNACVTALIAERIMR